MIVPLRRRSLAVSALFGMVLCLASVCCAQVAPATPITFRQRLDLERKITFGPGNFLTPVVEASSVQVFPPRSYPHSWSDGVGGFARNYGADFAVATTAGVGRFAAETVVRHDPRYFPSRNPRYPLRFLHALAFTFADRTDSGQRSFALGNLTGAFAAGGVSMAIYPDGFNDFTHAYQRFNKQYATFAAHNLLAEFAPEAVRVARFLHIPGRLANSLLPADRKQP